MGVVAFLFALGFTDLALLFSARFIFALLGRIRAVVADILVGLRQLILARRLAGLFIAGLFITGLFIAGTWLAGGRLLLQAAFSAARSFAAGGVVARLVLRLPLARSPFIWFAIRRSLAGLVSIFCVSALSLAVTGLFIGFLGSLAVGISAGVGVLFFTVGRFLPAFLLTIGVPATAFL